MGIKKVLSVIGAAAASVGAAVGAVNIFNKAVFKSAVKADSDYEKGMYFDWKEGKVHYKICGSGKPVILLHSLSIGSSHREWMMNIDALAKKYTVYAIDLPGYGYSDKPKITYTAFLYASFLKEFIESEIGDKASVIAANGSAMFAVIAAKLFPEKIDSLMLVSPGGINDKMAENSSFKKRTIMELPLEGTLSYNLKTSKKAIRSFLENDGFYAKERVTDDIVKAFYSSAHTEGGNARFAYASYITNYMNMDIKQYMKNLTMPLTVMWGEENTVFDTDAAQTVKDLVPWAKFYVFEKTKIFPHLENPEEFNKVVFINIK